MRKSLYSTGLTGVDFSNVIMQLKDKLLSCTVCPFHCRIDRYRESSGKCRSGYHPKIASWSLHHGEEPPISGYNGSGTIFFSGCSLRCRFCQNYPISQLENGNEATTEKLTEYMLDLQARGAHNINLVTPTHFVPQIIESLWHAVQKGLSLPIVYNSSGYEDLETLKLLEGIIDIYLPDMKYGKDRNAEKFSSAKGYVEINRNAITEMYRQVGELHTDAEGIAQRGLIIRHLVLPGNISNTYDVLEFIAQLSPTIPVSLMSQYFPAYTAPEIPELKRKLRKNEYKEASKLLDRFGLVNGWVQSVE